MQTYILKVDPDGRVTVPDVKPGQTVKVQVVPVPTERLTFGTARTDEERAEVIADIKRMSRELRELMKDALPVDHGELYGEDGLPA